MHDGNELQMQNFGNLLGLEVSGNCCSKKKKIKTQLLPDNSLYYETRIVVTLGVAAKLRS